MQRGDQRVERVRIDAGLYDRKVVANDEQVNLQVEAGVRSLEPRLDGGLVCGEIIVRSVRQIRVHRDTQRRSAAPL